MLVQLAQGAVVSGSFVCLPASETNAGTYPVTCTFTSADSNYVSGGTIGGSLVINAVGPKNLSATCVGGVYNATPYSCTGTATGVGGAAVAGSFNFVPGSETNAGTYSEIGVFTSTDPNYLSGNTASGTLVITQATPIIVIDSPMTFVYDGTTHALTCHATGVGGVIVAGACSVSGASSNAGSYSVVATFVSADPNYNNGAAQSGTLIVSQATPNLSATCAGGVYNGTAYSCTGTATGAGGATVAGSFAFAPGGETNVGSYPETGTFTSTNPNYMSGGTASATLVITAATPTLSATCAGGVYNGTAYSCTGTATGVGGAAVAGSFAFAPGTETNAGSYPETGTFTSTNPNYVSGGTASATLNIALVTQSPSVLCPGPLTYDGNAHSCTITGGFGTCTSASVTNVPGSGALALSCAGDSNHSAWSGAGSITINPAAPTLSVSCGSVTANGSAQPCLPGGTATGIGGVSVAGTWIYTYNENTTAPTLAGNYIVVGTFTSGNVDYSNGQATGSFVINPQGVVSVTLSCPVATYDKSAQGCTATPTPATAACSGLVSETNAGSYPESVTCTNAGYTAGSATGTLVINPTNPSLSATCTGGVYNGTAYSCTGSATGVGGEAVASSFVFAPGSETNAGSYPETGTFSTSNANYVSGGTTSALLIITPATPTLTLNCNPVTANGSPQACLPGGSATGIGGVAVAGTWTCTYNGGPIPMLAGTYAVVCTFTSSDPNYASGGTASASFVINPEPVVQVTLTCAPVIFDGSAHGCTATPTPSTASCSGLVSETNAGSYPESVSCSDAGFLSGTASGTLVISQAASSTTVTCNEVTYNGGAQSCTAAVIPAGSCTGLVPETNTGIYTETATCTPSNTNYAASSGSAAFKIDAATPTVTVNCPTVTFDSNAHSCTATATGVGGATVSGTFAFVPGAETAVGSYPETATFTSANSNYTNGSGTGTLVINPVSAGTPALTLSATSVTFASPIMLGQSAAAQYVLITSTGSASLQVSGVTMGGTNPGDFLVTNQAGTCTTGATLAYRAGCNLRVVFAPTGVGARSAILYINDNASGSPQQVLVSGTAVPGAQYTISATTLTFAPTTVGATAATQYITIKSTGYQPLVISQVVLSSGDFDLSDQAGTCTTAATTSLVPGADCNIRVKFHPTATGPLTASVVINNNSATSPVTVTLNGTGK